MDNVGTQFDNIAAKITKNVDEYMMQQMEAYGENMIDNIIPLQAGFKNLTGNTLTSFAYGTYLNKKLYNIGIFKGKSAKRWKLTAGEIFSGEDYDGNNRNYFKAEIDTDLGYGKDTSISFLESYTPKGVYSLVFTTGTEYSTYLETNLHLNVLTDARTYSIANFIRSFKPINNLNV